MPKRRRRKGEFTCTCSAYRFPHRFMGGRCNGISICEEAVNSGHRECFSCIHFEVATYDGEDHLSRSPCAIVNGQEDPIQCPIVQEFCSWHEVKKKF